MSLLHFALFLATAATASAKAKASPEADEPLVHEYIKLAFWLVLGMIIGVFFEARISLREVFKPIAQKGVTGLIIAGSIYGIFMFASIASRYL